MLTEHQLSIPSQNTPLCDPDGSPSRAWIGSLRAEADRVFEGDSTAELPDAVLLDLAANHSGYGTRPAGQVIRAAGHAIFRGLRSRPGSGIGPEVIDGIEWPGEQGHPEQWDMVALARQLGHEDRIAAAIAKAAEAHRAHIDENPRKDGKGPTPKAIRNAPAKAIEAMRAAIVGVREQTASPTISTRGVPKPVMPKGGRP